jgi:MoxR-like ATPase
MTNKLVPNSIDETLRCWRGANTSRSAPWHTAVFLALRMGRPLFLEGRGGVGKTEIAKVLAQVLDRQLIRLQCYEGLDIASAVYEWNLPAADDRDPARGNRGTGGREKLEKTSSANVF